LPPHFTAPAAPTLDPVARIAHAESFFAATGADIRHGGNQAYYVPSRDFVQMPPFETFKDAESYYATLGHECCHWTRHEKRLHRDFGRKRWGDEGYAAEELVAELGAAFLCADLAITPEPRADHASYIASWLDVLKNDKRAIFTAAAHAQRAADYLHGLQQPAEATGAAA
jgi:antirestriction protein ArdC